jgi:hypothetical protein
MRNITSRPTAELNDDTFEWRGFTVAYGDYATIAKLTPYGRNYVWKVLHGARKSAVVEAAALKFYSLRKELTGA